ncbi:MAG: hypothetical protein WA634_12735, partial [Silvibacterium sp.]
MLKIDLEFPHSYKVEELPELPGTGKFDAPLLYFPRPKTRPEHDGLWLRMRSATGKSWVGCFAFGYQSPPAISRIVSSPDPDKVCVVSRGTAYIVKVDEPDTWEELPIMPVIDLRVIPANQLLVLADFTRLIACGSNGLAWRSPQVCWDDLKIINVTRESIEGEGYDPINSGTSRFIVDIHTGCSLLP